MEFATKAVHAGYEPDKEFGAIMPPIYMTSTFIQDAPGESRGGYEYTRAHNPNFTILEKLLASLENASHATVFSSGLGTLTGLISSLTAGDKVLTISGLYGGTYRLFHSVFNHLGIECLSIPSSLEGLNDALNLHPKWLIFETPTNPLLDIYDIQHLAAEAKKRGVRTLVDNTFASPFCQNPLDLGADAVWHSTTKYIGGHSDVIGGVIMTNDPTLKEQLDFSRKALGLNPSPFDAWLTTRGVKTLALRMERHCQNAFVIAEHLSQLSITKKVYYPGLPSHPSHALAMKQMRGFSGIVSAEFNLTIDQMKSVISSFKIFSLAESLGGVESLVNHPATMTHASIPPEERARQGLSDGLVRFSVGIENVVDLIDDIDQALIKHGHEWKKIHIH